MILICTKVKFQGPLTALVGILQVTVCIWKQLHGLKFKRQTQV